MNHIDKFLNNITMYRLVLQGLFVLTGISIILGFLGQLPYSGFAFIISFFILTIVCYLSNVGLSKLFKAQINNESSSITALILFCIIAPPTNLREGLIIAGIALIAQASKYLLAKYKKHVFNPVAIAAVIAGLSGSVAVLWWIGSTILLPFILILGLLVVRKIRRFNLLFAFLGASLLTMLTFAIVNKTALANMLPDIILPFIFSSPLFFFATIMLTEPLTTPPTKKLQIIYGIIVGTIFSSQWHIALGALVIYPSPEFALVIGNLFSYFVSSKQRLLLTLTAKNKLSEQIQEFVFSPNKPLKFTAGQYLEWTLPHEHSDTRGVRRYFTVASAPTEKEIKLGVRIFPESSSFKQSLTHLSLGDMISAGSLSGDFTLPKDTTIPLAFIAGGIGITPFRSQIKELVDSNTKRNIALLYSANTSNDFVYTDIFNQAKDVGVNTTYIIADPKNIPQYWTGQTGFITKDMIEKVVPDYKNRIWYLSGPNAMVENYKRLLKNIGLPNKQIKTDYFPGF